MKTSGGDLASPRDFQRIWYEWVDVEKEKVSVRVMALESEEESILFQYCFGLGKGRIYVQEAMLSCQRVAFKMGLTLMLVSSSVVKPAVTLII